MGLVMGLVGNKVEGKARVIVSPAQQALDPVCGMNVEVGKAAKTEYGGDTYYFCCSHCQQAFENSPEEYMGGSRNIAHRVKHVFRYAFVDMVKEIGPELLLGLALAALVAAVAPVGEFVGAHFGGGLGYLFSLGFGLIMYICSTASVSPGPRFRVAGNEYWRGNAAPTGGSDYQLGYYAGPEKGVRWQDSGYLSGGRLCDVFGSGLLLLADIACEV